MTESLRVEGEEVSPEPVPPEAGPGRRLSEARQLKNLTVAKVAQHLHLDPRLVVALENNDYDRLPEPIYVSGYLRNYARLLGLPEEEIVGAYNRVDRPSPPILSELTRNAPRRPSVNQSVIQWGAVALVGIGLIVLGWQMSGNKRPAPAAAGHPSEAMPGPTAEKAKQAAVTPVVAPNEPQKPTTASVPAPGKGDVGAKPQPSATHGADQSPSVAVASGDTGTASAKTPAATLSLHFVDDSWVEVTDATGARVFYDLGEAGQTRTVSGSPPFKVLLGYSPGVSIEYNGVAFDQSRFTSRNNVARFTIGR